MISGSEIQVNKDGFLVTKFLYKKHANVNANFIFTIFIINLNYNTINYKLKSPKISKYFQAGYKLKRFKSSVIEK